MRSIFNTLFTLITIMFFCIGCEPDSQLQKVKVSCEHGACSDSVGGLPNSLNDPTNPENIDETIPVSQVSIVGDDSSGRQYSNGDFAASCADYRSSDYYQGQTGDGIYNVEPIEGSGSFKVYCDMSEDDGGWTLVWNNLRGGSGKPFSGIDWSTAISTIPLFGANPLSTDLESFIVYTGLDYYDEFSPEGKIRYQWSHDFGEAISHVVICDYELTEFSYALVLSNCSQEMGTTPSGFLNSSGRAFQVNAGNDCDPFMSPFWYTSSCIDGSITGGGEGSTFGIYNGAYWAGSDLQWGDTDGAGAGNGWIFIK